MGQQVTPLQAWAARGRSKRPLFEQQDSIRHAILHSHGRLQCVAIRQISRRDIKLDNAFGLAPGDIVTIELLSRRTLHGTVTWSVAAFCGIEFDRPLADNDLALTSA